MRALVAEAVFAGRGRRVRPVTDVFELARLARTLPVRYDEQLPPGVVVHGRWGADEWLAVRSYELATRVVCWRESCACDECAAARVERDCTTTGWYRYDARHVDAQRGSLRLHWSNYALAWSVVGDDLVLTEPGFTLARVAEP